MVDIERVRQEAYGELRAQVTAMGLTSDALRGETQALVNALRAPHVRGRWGEVQLRRVVEVAGMLEHCDFDEQPTLAAPDGPLRPDLVVRLAGGKNVAVDAKVPFAGIPDAQRSARSTLAATLPSLDAGVVGPGITRFRTPADGVLVELNGSILLP